MAVQAEIDMLGKTHLIVSEAIMSSACLCVPDTLMPLGHTAVFLAGGYFGALSPDLDKENTMAAHLFPRVARYIAKLGHRKWTHTIWALLLLSILPIFCTLVAIGWKCPNNESSLPWCFTMAALFLDGFWIGYLLHLLEDNQSVQGVMFLYPLTHYVVSKNTGHEYKQRPWSRFRYRTGGKAERIIRRIALIVLLIAMYQLVGGCYSLLLFGLLFLIL